MKQQPFSIYCEKFRLAIREFKIFAHGLSLDLRLFGFITLWRQTPCTSFVSSTANETSNESFKPNEHEFEIVCNAVDILCKNDCPRRAPRLLTVALIIFSPPKFRARRLFQMLRTDLCDLSLRIPVN